MKIKQHLVITDIERFNSGNDNTCFSLVGAGVVDSLPDYVDCGPVEVEVTVSKGKIIAQGVKRLEAQIINLQERRKALIDQERVDATDDT